MTKQKISATVDPERLARARALTGNGNVSDLIDRALGLVIDHELERRWLLAMTEASAASAEAPEVPVDLSDLPWDDDGARP